MMTDRSVINSLATLHKILDDGESGFSVSALNFKNRALKILFKTVAQQRARFKQEIRAELQRLGADIEPASSFLGMVHRGRINIFSSLIIETEGREKMILGEILLGEAAALRAYEKALQKDLPVDVRKIVARQYAEVRLVVDQVRLIRGWNGKRQLVFLYDSEKDVEKTTQSLRQAGFPAESVERMTLADFAETYHGKSRPFFEAALSGSIGGGLWGSVIGSLAGLGAMQSTGVDQALIMSPAEVWTVIALLGIAGGVLVGAFLGLFIGMGVSEEDQHQYQHSMEYGTVIVKIMIDERRAKEAGRILSGAQLVPELTK